LEALTARIEALEGLVGERDARISALENALKIAEAKAEKETQDNEVQKSTELAWPSKRVREAFIEFFRDENEHTFWKSSPCVPHDDPTLLFTNAGMNQFKPLFLGQCDPNVPMYGMKRAVNSQKCIRAGGKHNDLDDVGKDVYHHTYFEMLGNWSFGDFFKEEAIRMTWECLTVKFGLDPERLYVTYFGGDEVKAPGVPPDNVSRDIWLKYVPESRLLAFDATDNFWEMGDVGPCGPCSEIHYDRIGGRDASQLVNIDDPDVLEIWNNVFMEYNREPEGLKKLPAQHVDTGMGFERLTSILQNKNSNYDTDVFTPLFDAIQKLTGAPAYTGKIGDEDVDTKDMAYRVVADHIRTLSFAIADGARPDTVGRGYVLRRILRRAVYFGRFLGVPEGECFFHKLVPAVVDTYGDFFDELPPAANKITKVLLDEETQFNRTISQGNKVFTKKVNALQSQGINVLPGSVAFLLSGSLGFPLDLTEIMCEARGMTVDKDEFHALMEKDKEGNRKGGGEGEKDMVMMAKETTYLTDIAVTDQAPKYQQDVITAKVVAIFTGRGKLPDEQGFVDKADESNGKVGLVLDTTNFYAQQGGQVYDTGLLVGDDKSLNVTDVQVYAGYVLHIGMVQEGTIAVGDNLKCVVDLERRDLVVPNHTMTHVLNFALRSVLMGGPDDEAEKEGKLNQKGSDVNGDRLRFDFNWDESLTSEQISAVENMVNKSIAKDIVVYDKVVALAPARKIFGLRAVFGETYPDPVRVVSVGVPVDDLLANPDNKQWADYSVEFCGGTHLKSLGLTEQFAIIEEGSASAGIRRLVAVTRQRAQDVMVVGKQLLIEVGRVEGIPKGPEFVTAVKKLRKDFNAMSAVHLVSKYEAAKRIVVLEQACLEILKQATKQMEAAAIDAAKALITSSGDSLPEKCVARIDFGNSGKTNSAIMKVLTKANKKGSFLIVSADVENNAVCVYANVAKTQASVDAFKWCGAALAPLGGGKCGGKEKNAMGSAPGVDKIDEVVAAAQAFVADE
jgi:alanyl-tRNA synthetase